MIPAPAKPALKRDPVLSLDAPWRYFALLLIPLRPAGLVTLILLTAVLSLSLKAGPFGVPLAGILLGWFFKYSFECLDRLTAGSSEAPVLSMETIARTLGEFRWLIPLVFAILFLFSFGVGPALFRWIAGVVAAVGLLFCLPAMLVIQGWTGRLSHSLNPFVWKMAMQVLGPDYGWLVLCASALLICCAVLPTAIAGAPMALRLGLALYGWLGFIAVTGGALNSKRDELDERLPLVIPQYKTFSLKEIERDRERWLDSIYASWRSKAVETAFAVVTERLTGERQPLADLRWLMGRVSTWEPPKFSNRVAMLLISNLLQQGRDAEALQRFRERREMGAISELADTEARGRLARTARAWGDISLAESLEPGERSG
jgi:hypothetical protein